MNKGKRKLNNNQKLKSKAKKNPNRKYLIFAMILIILVVIGILYYVASSRSEYNRVESVLKDSITSIENVLMIPVEFVQDKCGNFKNIDKLKKENEKLKEKTNKVELLEGENRELKKEIENLKSELGLNSVLSDYDSINATVIVRNVSSWYNNVTIDKGSKDGIKPGMVVINATGVIGKINSVTKHTSSVKMITTNDTNNKISVAIYSGDNKLYGVINGYDYDKKQATIEGISNTDTVISGDKVYTSGLGGVFPAGILIGTVVDINTDAYDLAKIISVSLSANFEDLNYVTVLKRKSDTDVD